jgi:hypothetical protein
LKEEGRRKKEEGKFNKCSAGLRPAIGLISETTNPILKLFNFSS